MEKDNIDPTAQQFLLAFKDRNIDELSDLLDDTSNEFEIQDTEGANLMVNKMLYLKWLKPKLKANEVYDIKFDKCTSCVVGNPVLIINYGSFPYLMKSSDEALIIGLMFGVKSEKINTIKFCNSFAKTKIKYAFECKAEVMKVYLNLGFSFGEAYTICSEGTPSDAFTYYKQTEKGIEYKTLYYNDEVLFGILGQEPKYITQDHYSKQYANQFFYAKWLDIVTEYNYVPDFKTINVRFDLSNLNEKERSRAETVIIGATFISLYLYGLGVIKQNHIIPETNDRFRAFNEVDDFIYAKIEVPNVDGINEMILNMLKSEHPPAQIMEDN
ncbi:MAG: hypothetical protein IPG89_08220 [Bacteroidetes bacterium]|nr:hypothetical protein [Bacteroidota bacterium]